MEWREQHRDMLAKGLVGERTVLLPMDRSVNRASLASTRSVSERNKMLVAITGQISDHATSPLTQEPEEGDYMPTQLKAKVNFDDNGSAVERFCFRWTDP
jgi:hypothetical protein